MAWIDDLTGKTASDAQRSAIDRQQEQAAQQWYTARDIWNENRGALSTITGQYQQAAPQIGNLFQNQVAGYGATLGGQANALLKNSQTALTSEFQGALKDIYTQGRNQAASSGLIGGFQEGQNVAPQIAALGRSYATTLQQNQNQNNQALMGIYGQAYQGNVGAAQQAGQWALSPYAATQGIYGNLVGQALSGMSNAGRNYTSSLGNYSSGPNPLGNIFGAIGNLGSGALGLAALGIV